MSFCIHKFSKVREHINKRHSDLDVEFRARRMAQENANSRVRAQSFANLNTLSNLSWLPYPAYALQVCMYLMSALSVGLFEIDVLGERHFFRI